MLIIISTLLPCIVQVLRGTKAHFAPDQRFLMNFSDQVSVFKIIQIHSSTCLLKCTLWYDYQRSKEALIAT
ncbi:hypothetical protein BD289DRAFT_431787 [Coniella lustricola]|uniref:Secreted protein n=1 Tax=Coniella lustricola TaxID=2025994 RepID=A0A2T3AAF6_9PEZI|nr:hypothetical protein BD289DRAFT_431787 [Coniella lustricola]